MAAAVDVDLASGDSYIYILIAGFFINLAGDLFVQELIIYQTIIFRISGSPLLSFGCGLSARPLQCESLVLFLLR